MELYPLKSGLIRPHESLIETVERAVTSSGRRIRDGDIVAVTSKVVSICEGRIVDLSAIKPGKNACRLAKRYDLPPDFAQVIENEADEIYGGVKGALLTIKDGQATANAGVDQKNSVDNSVVVWPEDPRKSALRLQQGLTRKTGKRVGVIIVDSRVTPLRLGTVGLSLASVGFIAVKDFRGEPDLNGRKIRVTFQALGDGLAAAAHVLMGESRERVPFVLVREAPVDFKGRSSIEEKIGLQGCLYMSQIFAQAKVPSA